MKIEYLQDGIFQQMGRFSSRLCTVKKVYRGILEL
jgi:hypothetical protein